MRTIPLTGSCYVRMTMGKMLDSLRWADVAGQDSR
jgi:hypothetical protein